MAEKTGQDIVMENMEDQENICAIKRHVNKATTTTLVRIHRLY